jgi:hypothetical protein
VKHERKRLRTFLEGKLEAKSLELTQVSPKRTLLILEPRTFPGTGIILLLSHPCDRVRWWLFSKFFSESLSEDEKLILTLMEIKGSDEEYSFFKEVRDFDFQTLGIESRMALLQKVNELFSFTRGNPTEFWKTFQPSLSIKRVWFDKRKLAPVSRIGVGYKDKGSLREGSFELSPDLTLSPSSKWMTLSLLFRLLVGLPIVPDSPGRIRFSRRGGRPADEPQRAKR